LCKKAAELTANLIS